MIYGVFLLRLIRIVILVLDSTLLSTLVLPEHSINTYGELLYQPTKNLYRDLSYIQIIAIIDTTTHRKYCLYCGCAKLTGIFDRVTDKSGFRWYMQYPILTH